MSENARNDFPYIEIKELRLKVKDIYATLESSIKLKTTKSRGSKGYKRLKDLVFECTGKLLGDATIVDFFTKSPFFDERGKEVVSFEYFTIDAFKEFVEKNDLYSSKTFLPPEIMLYSDPSTGKTTPKLIEIDSQLLENIKLVLHREFERNKSSSKIDMKKVCDEQGKVTVMVDCCITAKSEISVLRVQCFADNAISIDGIYAYETVTKAPIPALLYYSNDRCYYWYLVLPTVLKPHDTLYYSYHFTAKDYFKAFLSRKYEEDELVPVPNRYSQVTNEFYFPNVNKFSALTVKVKAHPNQHLVGKNIRPVIAGNWIAYKIDHGDLSTADTPIQIALDMRTRKEQKE